ncbi:putative ribonuclease h protein [Quercus suber]|uniref:Ribonuclease h protein n=1 Tax=Quercus suber TaxID=58331 RepID=A0AAW0J9C7_QUESU
MEIKATPIPYSKLREDRLSWSSSSSGKFHLKDAYHIVWKIPSLPRIKCFLWQCCHQSILVRALLAKRGMNISPICPMCNAAPETISHALRDCPKVQSFWNSFSPPVSASIFYGTQILDWLRLNCKSMQQCDVADLDWAILFPIAV